MLVNLLFINMTNLSNRENFLVFITFIVVAASITLSLCICFILPNYITSNDYVSNWDNKSIEELKNQCECFLKPRESTDCKPHKLPTRFGKANLQCSRDDWNLMKSFSYLASLTDPAYVDDKDIRIFVCSAVIVAKNRILGGWTCIKEKSSDELNEMRVRVGSIYWSKGGQEFQGLSRYLDYRGLQVMIPNTTFSFNDQIQALRLPTPGKIFPMSWAVTPDWETNKLHASFYFKNWTNYPCQNYDTKGEILNNVYFDEGAKSLPLVNEENVIVGFLGDIEIVFQEKPAYLFADLQCDTYPVWLQHSVNDDSSGPHVNLCFHSESILIYEGKHCDISEFISKSAVISRSTIEEKVIDIRDKPVFRSNANESP